MAYYSKSYGASFNVGYWLTILIVTVLILILAFEIWMLVDAIKNESLSSEERAIWVVGMLLVHPFVAVAYYFMRRSSKLK